jgi:hypothetical protein
MTHENVGVTPGLFQRNSLNGFFWIYVATFCVLALYALSAQMFGQNWRALLPGAEEAQSMWNGVKSASYTLISQLSNGG